MFSFCPSMYSTQKASCQDMMSLHKKTWVNVQSKICKNTWMQISYPDHFQWLSLNTHRGKKKVKDTEWLKEVSLANMKLQCLFSHPVTSIFAWSAWPIMKKPLKRKDQQTRNLTRFPQLPSSPCYTGTESYLHK